MKGCVEIVSLRTILKLINFFDFEMGNGFADKLF